MYKVCASLDKETKEIGRTKIFTPGWLENESIWLHMEYKYLLETLRKGLYEQFFRDFKEMLIPFQDPQVYGRNILENSSFIASSSNPDKKLHGNGFVARLSGSTAELLHMWLLMMAGEQPFFLNNEEKLCLKFNPSLPKWIFSKTNTEFEYFINGKKEKFILEKNCLAFVFLGKILVVYHNNEKGNTFGASAKKPQSFSFNLDNKNITIDSDFIPSPYAERIRNCETDRIDIYLY